MNRNIKRLIKSAKSVPDMRRQWGYMLHRLAGILMIAFCAIICGAQTYRDIELFGRAKELWRSTFLALSNGIPSADTFERIFELLDPKIVVQKMRWLLQTEEVAGKIMAFDGKTMKGSTKAEQQAFHTLSAFLVDSQTVIEEVMYDEKSNEITAIPESLDELEVAGSIVIIDAMGTQTKITEKIVGKKADYCLALKGNQSSLHDDVRLYFKTETIANTKQITEHGHGRIEKREYFLETEIDWLYGREHWTGIAAIGAVKSTVVIKGNTLSEMRYFITSLTNIGNFSRAVRAHWRIKNCPHWHLDMMFGEDSSHVRNKNAAGF